MTKTLISTLDPDDYLRGRIAEDLLALLKIRSRWHPSFKQALMDLDDLQHRCPFAHETSRGVGDLTPCPTRYVELCGCQKDGIPHRRAHWTRAA